MTAPVETSYKREPIRFKPCHSPAELAKIWSKRRDEAILKRINHILMQSDENIARSKAVRETLKDIKEMLK